MMFRALRSGEESLLLDESRLRGNAEGVAFVRETAELVQALGEIDRRRARVTVQGSRTGLMGGAVPQGGYLINLQNMNRILALREEGGCFFLRVQAGVSLEQIARFCAHPVPQDGWSAESTAALQALTHSPRQFFAPNPTEQSATIGAAFALNAGGCNALRCGRVAEQVTALSWVTPQGGRLELRRGQACFTAAGCRLPDGRQLPLTGQGFTPIPEKLPAPGMDFIDFLAGSACTRGVAAELELRLARRPECSWAVLYFFSGEEQAMCFLDFLRSQQAEALYACEFYDRMVLTLLAQNKRQSAALKGLADFPDSGAALYVELCGEEEEALQALLLAQLEAYLACGGAEENAWAAGSLSEAEPFRRLRHAVPELLNSRLDELRLVYPELVKTTADYSAKPELAAQYLAMYRSAIETSGIEGYVFGHIYENHLHVNLLPRSREEQAVYRDLLQQWGEQTCAQGGSLAAENGIGRSKTWLRERFLTQEQRAAYQQLQLFFDPNGIMD